MTRPIPILLYGDVDLNIVDGSAVWLTSLAEVLTHHPRVELTVLLKAPEQRDLLSGSLRALPRTTVVEPSGGGRMRPPAAVDRIEELDRATPFAAIVLRGLAISTVAAGRPQLYGRLWPYLTDIPQRTADLTAESRRTLADIAAASDLLLCQTPELRDHLESAIPPAERRTALLPPMVPALFHPPTGTPGAGTADRLVYAGKFAPLWGVERLVDAVVAATAGHPGLELHVVGDKIHDPPDDPGFGPAMRARLEQGPPVVWHGAVTRERVAELLREVDVAFSVRDPRMDDSLELSTKILEYGASGVPVVCNRTAMHERLLGADYPLFVDDLDQLHAAVVRVTRDETALTMARERCRRLAEAHRSGAIAAHLEPYLDRLAPERPAPRSTSRPHRLLVAGHDLKFLRPYLPWFTRVGIEVRIDAWHGYEDHDEDASRQALDWADTILAEWCLGNATWYAEHRTRQRLVVRLHRMELTTPYPAALAETRPDALIAVSRHVGEELVEDHGWDHAQLVILPNAVDTLRLDRRKLASAPRTLGMIGVLPKLKRLDRALDLLETLLRADPRWRLRIAGLLPFDSSWVWARLDEKAYFADQLDRVRRSPRLRRAVSLDGPVADVATWLRQVGVILSPSDVESFHLAVAEGMASGAEPIIWPRLGASELFPGPWSVADTAAAATRLTTDRDPAAGQAAAALVRARYATDAIAPRLVEQVLG